MNLSLFYLIGFLKNYSGGFSVSEAIFQRISFVGDDFEISQQKKDIFKKLITICESTLNESGLDNDISIEYWNDEKGAILYSKNIVGLICDFFKSKDSYTDQGHFILDEYLFDDFDRKNEASFSYQQRLKFLFGVFDSNGDNNKLYFYNDYRKCILVHYVLKCFGDEDDTIEMKSYFKTPMTDCISVNKNGEIWSVLKKYCS
jgi:hypothetical protein